MKRVRRTQMLAAAGGLAVSGILGSVVQAQSLFNTQTDFEGWAFLGNNINPVERRCHRLQRYARRNRRHQQFF